MSKSWRVVPAVVLLLLVGGCVSRTGPEARPASSTPPEPPGQALVAWAGRLCAASGQLTSEHDSGRDLVTEPADQFILVQARHYLGFVDATVAMAAQEFGRLGESGIEEADEYVAFVTAELARIQPEVNQLAAETATAFQMPDAEVLRRVRSLVELFDSVERATGDLESLVEESREFAAAYDMAPGCDPETPPTGTPTGSSAPPSAGSSTTPPTGMPKAADGTDLAACADGSCEVELRGNAEVRVGSFVLGVTVSRGSVTVTNDFGGGGGGMATLGGPGGQASFGTGGQTVTVSLSGVQGNRAVVKFAIE